MPRRRGRRFIEEKPGWSVFKPQGVQIQDLDTIQLGLDELEALKHCDRDGLYQEEAAEILGISRPTLTRILEEARRKVAQALTNGMAIQIQEDPNMIQQTRRFICTQCNNAWDVPFGIGRPIQCPSCGSNAVFREGCRLAGGFGAGRGGGFGLGRGGGMGRGRRGGGMGRGRYSNVQPPVDGTNPNPNPNQNPS